MVDKVRVLIVDDSAFFRKRIRQNLAASHEIEVVGEAENGEQAIEMVTRYKPDIVTMDVAMPVMDGIAAVRGIMRTQPTDIIMFSAFTREGAQQTLDALDAGAIDFVAKQGQASDGGQQTSGGLLREKILQIARNSRKPIRPTVFTAPVGRQVGTADSRPHDLKLIVIGASTGGPVAIQDVLAKLPAGFRHPLLVAVHMPGTFTSTFAERLNQQCAIEVAEAVDGSVLSPGRVLIAPGGHQTLVRRKGSSLVVSVTDGVGQLYKPSIDLTFASAASAAGSGVLAVILTGMGSDGAKGAFDLKQVGATVWSQDESSCVVYGMPQAVAKAGTTDRVLPLVRIGPELAGVG